MLTLESSRTTTSSPDMLVRGKHDLVAESSGALGENLP